MRKEIKVGDVVAVLTFAKVVDKVDGKNNTGRVTVQDLYDSGNVFDVVGDDLVDKMHSADRFSKVEKITKTEAALMMGTLYNKPFTVKFLKDNGEERVLRGRMLDPETGMGRSQVEDFDVKDSNGNTVTNVVKRMRQVNHREIIYIIVDDTKYEVKR